AGDVAPDVEQRRRLGNFGQEGRERRIVGKQHHRAEPIELIQDFVAGARRDGADRARRGAAEPGERSDGAGGSVQGGAGALEGGHERGETRGADPGHLRERQIRRYFVATAAGSACHSVSNSCGIPCPLTADTATTRAPARVRIVGMGDAGWERSSLVSTTTCGFAASSGEYDAASRNSSS